MSDNLYKTSPAGMSGPEPQTGVKAGKGFGEFNFSAAFSLGWKSFERDIPRNTALTLLFMVIFVLSYLSVAVLVGLFIFPALAAAFPMIGLYMVRGKLETSHIFVGFKAYGRVLLSFWLQIIVSATPMVIVIFGIPALFGQSMEPFLDQTSTVEPEMNPSTVIMIFLIYGLIFAYSIGMWYFIARFMLHIPLMIERDYGLIESLKASWGATRKNQGGLCLFLFAAYSLSSFGMFFFCIGIFVSYAFSLALIGAAISQLLGDVPVESKT